ncbi:site-specific integrase [Levilactobacillus cerevisiae]|uniref:tyrosine-type recombinase/integrase n=2 Tax=Levilactobacillus cerevisiae TaxID=1704076 RepID=UPI000F773538|nr:site-specific integrase [Levilactobacillus cerevisiae]
MIIMATTKYPGVYTGKDGKIFYRVELGTDKVTGKRIQKTKRRSEQGQPFRSAHEAYKELTRVKNQYLEQQGYANYRISYRTFMRENYIPSYKADVEKSTYSSRKSVFEHLVDRFGDIVLRDITVLQCEQFRSYLLNDSGYSQGFSHLVYGSFRKSLDYAVQVGFLNENVSKKTKSVAKGKAQVPIWTKSEFEQVISKIYLPSYYEHFCFVMLWVYFMTGCRVGEGLALQWSDVDLKRRKLKIHRTLDIRNKMDYDLKPYTKTESGMRTISIDGDTCRILSEWQKAQRRRGVKHFVMSYDDTPTIRSSVQNIIRRYADLAGVPRIQAKALRHSHVSYLINEFNIDVLSISQRLGHSSPDITLKYYAHLWRGSNEKVAEQLTGSINLTPAKSSSVNFTGNQVVKNPMQGLFPTKSLPDNDTAV